MRYALRRVAGGDAGGREPRAARVGTAARVRMDEIWLDGLFFIAYGCPVLGCVVLLWMLSTEIWYAATVAQYGVSICWYRTEKVYAATRSSHRGRCNCRKRGQLRYQPTRVLRDARY
eukprot:887309-Rhodomonas_salina.3